MCNPTRRPTDGTVPIRFGTYNIRNGRRGGLESTLRRMSQANMDLGILQETKIMNGIYTRGSAGYTVIATDAPSRHRGGDLGLGMVSMAITLTMIYSMIL